MKEFSFTSLLLGMLLAIIFGAANAYLGLKVGMTVCASIPAAVVSMAIVRGILRRKSILENNMVQTIASAGESLAAGVIFTIPALIIWGIQPSILKIFVISVLGGFLGVLFMIPLRRYLIVKEHKRLPYPEGTACAKVLTAGDEGGVKAKSVFSGLAVGGVYKFLMSGLGLWNESPGWQIKGYKNAYIGADITPALLGVGYIIGPKISAYIFAGGLLGWLVLIPLISIFGTETIFPAAEPIAKLTAHQIWHFYIRYVGAGAVALGGILSLVRAFPVIISSFRSAVVEFIEKRVALKREERDLPISVVIIGSIVIAILIWHIPFINLNLLGAILVVIFAFFFVTVSSRLVGLVGSSSNPASGMTIATLLATSLIFSALGWTGTEGMVAALSVGAVVCIAICMAGDISQDLKTGYLVSATPENQQIGEFIGVLTSALVIGLTIFLLDATYKIGSPKLPAPQAMLMSIVIKGVIQHNLPWGLILAGIGIAAVVELFGIPSLPFAVGLYLPISLSTPIIMGGMIKRIRDTERGVLFSSGLIAGGAVMGILIAILKFKEIELSLGFKFGNSFSLLIFLLLCGILIREVTRIMNKNQS